MYEYSFFYLDHEAELPELSHVMSTNKSKSLRRRINARLNRYACRYQWLRCPGLPPEIQLVPTNSCNLKCRACPKTYYKTDNRHLMPEVYQRVREQLFPWIKILNLQGLGEPLLSPVFEEMLEDAADFGLKIKFVTNAMRLTPELMKGIVKAGADMTVSIDGSRAETHEDSRVGSDFSFIMNALGALKSLSDKTPDTGFQLSVNTVVTRRNVNELPDILKIAAGFGAKRMTIINPGVGERKDDFARDVISRHKELLHNVMKDLIKQSQKYGIHLIYPEFAVEEEPKSGKDECATIARKSLFPGTCLDPWRISYIDVDGWVRPCCRGVWIGMGNIMETSFRKIWNGVHYRKLRRYVNSNNPPSFCRGCTLWWGITGGDELYVERLNRRGIELPEAPEIGVSGKD